jgi:alkanesulfonate monooxygenase SsuD/methylene tetrahydromethanopterin reductase-like flavin-dependent oxidoreductase (luciferase family)
MVYLHYDMIGHPDGVPHTQLYREAINIAEYADSHGGQRIVFSEHHMADYMASPIGLANAIASRTRHQQLCFECIILPNYDLMHLAEQIAQLDIISNGRLIVAVAWGYVAADRAMFPRSMKAAEYFDKAIPALRQAWAGERFEFDGRTGKLAQLPVKQSIQLVIGGSVPNAAVRAARHGDGFAPSHSYIVENYYEECAKLGKTPGEVLHPPGHYFLHVTRNPEQDWQRIRPFVVNDIDTYWQWLKDIPGMVYEAPPMTAEQCNAAGKYRILTPEQAIEYLQSQDTVYTKPLLGGLDPDIAWDSIKLLFEEVIPAL